MIRLLIRFLANPRLIGSFIPSSESLAIAMTRQIGENSIVFEIGAGTGAITRQISRKHHASLIVFEQDRGLAEYLRNCVPNAKVLDGLFHETIEALDDIPEDLVILSSVPFKSLNRKLYLDTVTAICELLLNFPTRRLIQYSYSTNPPFKPNHSSLRWNRLERVWKNAPPATVWELRGAAETRGVREKIEAR